MKTAVFFVAIVVFFSPQLLLSQETPSQWLIGHWEGSIEGYSGQEGSSRTLRVHTVSSDGTALGLWAVTGQNAFLSDVKVEGSKVNIAVAGSKSVVELAREVDGSLAGKFTFQSGKAFPIKLSKIKLSNEFDGAWEGKATVNPPNSRDCTSGSYEFTVKDSLITGSLEIASRSAAGARWRSSVTGEIRPDHTAVLEVKGEPGVYNALSTRFSGTFTSTEFRGNDPAVGTRRCGYDVELKRR